LGASFAENRVQHAIKSLGLSHVLTNGTHTSALSGGEAQRVMLARIQTIDCDVLILDEPCSFLDNRVKGSFLAALRTTVDDNRLLALMVTHVWDEARLVADNVVFFHQPNGRPVTLHRGSVHQVTNYPPTIDALFTIYWPDCAVLDRSAIISLPGELKRAIPSGAFSIGLFRSQTTIDAWAEQLWNHIARTKTESPSQSHGPSACQAGPILGKCVFFGHDGIALQSDERAPH
jgi:hypothetical protein